MKLLSHSDFAKLVGCSRQLVSRHVENGELPANADGKIDPWQAVPLWIERIKNPMLNGATRADEAVEYKVELARLTKAKADREEINAAIAKSEVIGVEDAKEAALAIGAAVQSQIKSLRASLPPMLEGMTPAQMTKKIAGETDKILLSLSDSSLTIYKPKKKA